MVEGQISVETNSASPPMLAAHEQTAGRHKLGTYLSHLSTRITPASTCGALPNAWGLGVGQ